MAEILRDRTIFSVEGVDKEKFLQSIITNDITKLPQDKILYTYILTPQGKFLYDFFIYDIKNIFFIDIATIVKDEFYKFINFYKLQMDVKIKEEIEKRILYLTFEDEINADITAFNDPRSKNMGRRAIVTKEYDVSNIFKEEYEYTRIKNTIAEGYKDLIPKKDFILEFDAERLNAISFTKGCYIGQEVVTRTKNRGTVRKFVRTLSYNSDDKPEFGKEIIYENITGEIRSYHRGIMLVVFKHNI